jgi:GTP cyclohydrolase IB
MESITNQSYTTGEQFKHVKNTNTQSYDWLGEDKESAITSDSNNTNGSYREPDRTYDTNLKVDAAYIATLPDLQNGPSSLIQGAKVAIQQVGIHNFKLPLKWTRQSGDPIELETAVTGTVSLAAEKKGINMSRIIRSFYEHKGNVFNADYIEDILRLYKSNLQTFDAKIILKISYPIIQKSLRSGNHGYQYYNIAVECNLDQAHVFERIVHFDFVYSSACPCSYELGEHARKYRNKAVVSHSQRSVARISIKYDKHVWFEEIQQMCVKALATETQVMVKREDEQAFAELNGANLKFVEDASRLLYEVFNNDGRIIDFKIICSHLESLHSHDAIGCIVKGVDKGFTPSVSEAELRSLVR